MGRKADIISGLSAGLLGLASLTACQAQAAPSTGAPGSSTAAPAAVAGPQSTAGARDYSFTLPIARYSLTPQQSVVLNEAENSLTEQCLQRYGLSYRFPPQQISMLADRHYGLSDPVSARQYGYHVPPRSTGAESAPPVSPELIDALQGPSGALGALGTSAPSEINGIPVPKNGCHGQAVEQIEGRHFVPAASAAADRIAHSGYSEAMSDPRVSKVMQAWSACMRGNGFAYATPLDAMNDPAFNEQTASAREIAVATSDVACKTRTGLLDAWFKVESADEEAMIAQNTALLGSLVQAHSAELADANALLHH